MAKRRFPRRHDKGGRGGSTGVRLKPCTQEVARRRIVQLRRELAAITEELLEFLSPVSPDDPDDEDEVHPLREAVGDCVRLLRRNADAADAHPQQFDKVLEQKFASDSRDGCLTTLQLLLKQLRALCLEETVVPQDAEMGLTLPVQPARVEYLFAQAILRLGRIWYLAYADPHELLLPDSLDSDPDNEKFRRAALGCWEMVYAQLPEGFREKAFPKELSVALLLLLYKGRGRPPLSGTVWVS
jgi:hypothetical protein